MKKRIRNKDKETTYQCGFEQHPEGHFEIGGKSYRPFWPRGLPDNRDEDVIYDFVEKVVNVLNDFYKKTKEYPSRVDSLRFPDGSIEVIIKQPSKKEMLYYF